jgi:hypothetical protein
MEPQPAPKKLLDQMRDAVRLKHYCYCTEETYVGWVTRYVLFQDKRHSNDLGAPICLRAWGQFQRAVQDLPRAVPGPIGASSGKRRAYSLKTP